MPLNSRVDSLFDRHVTRVVLERVDGELIVVEVEFDKPVEAERVEAEPLTSAVSKRSARR